ncbi:hypothetical protein CH063_12090 [Colletotrichum higginsianum]|uniref:FAD dependent oxidoreductase domain-containing protein n=1 Tax=Colletotrichum higginsianum (strain IMI 349063) TaxID=759273 RepID=H1VP16_COLHI|nr:hypothetical protein CH063_12090 [Colletotrichum higginsianum]
MGPAFVGLMARNSWASRKDSPAPARASRPNMAGGPSDDRRSQHCMYGGDWRPSKSIIVSSSVVRLTQTYWAIVHMLSRPFRNISAGVIGLSTAVRLQQDGYNVAIVAKDFPSPFEAVDAKASINYTSQWGGAHNRWVIPANETEERDHAMALVTFQQMESLNKSNPEAGITFMPGIEYLENPPAQYRSLTEEKAKSLGLVEFRRLKPSEFPDDKVKWGCEYWTWCVNPMIYCSFLLRRFSWNGGKVFRREISNPREGFTIKGLADVRAVINCSGVGFGDKDSFITRGQTCAVANYSPATVTRQNADGSWSFCVPRNFDGGTIVGGTKEPDNWDP